MAFLHDLLNGNGVKNVLTLDADYSRMAGPSRDWQSRFFKTFLMELIKKLGEEQRMGCYLNTV
jgi:hypothetical protein